MYWKAVSKETFALKYCLDRYNTQEMCEKKSSCLSIIIETCPWFVGHPKILDGLDSHESFSDARALDNHGPGNVTFLIIILIMLHSLRLLYPLLI